MLPFSWRRFRRVSPKLTRLNYTLAKLFVIDTVQVVNEFLKFSIKVEVLSVVQQILESLEAGIGFDGIWLVLLRARSIRIGETLDKDIPTFFRHERIILALLVEEGLSLRWDGGHGAINRQQLISAGSIQVGCR